MQSKPLVSIYIPYYNDEKFLKTSIEAVLNNDYQNFELVLLNHATTDSCREIAHSYKDSRIKHVDMEKNYGAGGGLLFEKMLEIAKGKYIKPLCADDVLRKDGLSTLVEYMENNTNIDFAFGDIEYINVNGKDLENSWFQERKYFSINNTEADCIRLYAEGHSFLPYVGSIIKRNILKNIPINKTYIMTFDMYLWAILLCDGYKIGYINEKVVNYRIHDLQVSSLANEINAIAYSPVEFRTFVYTFFRIKSISLAKQVWADSKFVDRLTKAEDLDFFIAYNIFIENGLYGAASLCIDMMLNDDCKSKRIKQVFNYDIKDFRNDIFNLTLKDRKLSRFKRYKHSVYSKRIRELNLCELLFLLARQIFNILSFSKFRHKKKNKRYSL